MLVQTPPPSKKRSEKQLSAKILAALEQGDKKAKMLEYHNEDFLNKSMCAEGFTYLELQIAFDLISPKTGYKDPIDTVIDMEDYDICAEACSFITGSSLEIVAEPSDGKVHVVAEGYYNAIGS
ncbi:conserved hypothetical protein [Vibrio chagasii]|nr:conserved hypothetical protein [Vibrio chagasii]